MQNQTTGPPSPAVTALTCNGFPKFYADVFPILVNFLNRHFRNILHAQPVLCMLQEHFIDVYSKGADLAVNLYEHSLTT